ncbi:hypothetical protein EIP86_001749 [Pleurotus ostreatoroseus]|nr:hypothetical protein EIP86_001749 [Pleurotus ostreatoroseus]
MLSAVAARKARLQSKEQSSTPPAPTPQTSPSPQPIQKTKHHAKPPSKRKPSSEAAKPPSSKKRKVNKPKEKPARYFQEADAFKAQEDVIVIEDDEDEDEETSEEEEGISPSVPTKRAWSPSEPLRDSSDEEDGEGLEDSPFETEEPMITETAAPVQNTPPVLSTYRPIPDQNLFDLEEDETKNLSIPSSHPAKLICLAPSDRLALIGTYTLLVLHGSVALSGVTLASSKVAHRVYAPRSAPLPVVECLPVTNRPPEKLAEDLPPRLQNLAPNFAALIVLQELHTGVEGLGRVCRTFDGVFGLSRWQKNQGLVDLGLQTAHYAKFVTHESQEFVLPPSWSSAISSVSPPLGREEVDYSRQVYLVKGPKKCGKSTFARTLLNNLVTRYRRVVFLECDLGQSEFTPGGMVALNVVSTPVFGIYLYFATYVCALNGSIAGPPFTHPSVPHQAHYIGSTSPRNCPSYYLETISALMQTYNMDVQHASLEDGDISDSRIADVIPLVVNMMGWTKGLGADLSKRVEETVEPSAIFEFDAPVPDDAWPTYQMHVVGDLPSTSELPMDANGTRTYRLEPISQAIISTKYTPTDQRTLSILSYFHAILPAPSLASQELRSEYASSWNTALPLCAQLPYELTAKNALDDVILIGPGSEDVVSSEIKRVLNGAIVGMVSCEPGAVDRAVDDDPGAATTSIPYVQGVAPPSPSVSNCHGLALIRSVSNSSTDMPSTLLHVLTPLNPPILTEARPRVFIKGEMELPVWGMLDFRSEDSVAGIEKGKVPFLQWGKGEGVGGERRRVRRNLMRKGQM